MIALIFFILLVAVLMYRWMPRLAHYVFVLSFIVAIFWLRHHVTDALNLSF